MAKKGINITKTDVLLAIVIILLLFGAGCYYQPVTDDDSANGGTTPPQETDLVDTCSGVIPPGGVSFDTMVSFCAQFDCPENKCCYPQMVDDITHPDNYTCQCVYEHL